MTPAQIEEARRWTRLKGWRWMPGMMADWHHTLRGCRGQMMQASAARVTLGTIDLGHPSNTGVVGYGSVPRGAVPDLTDPATRGCLLALAREITGSHVHVVCVDDDMYRCMCRRRGDDGRWTAYSSSGTTETAALLAACERHEATP